jgi:hypothetical protein
MKEDARFEVLTAVSIKIEVFWDVMQCRLLNSYCCFGRERPLLVDCPRKVGKYLPVNTA